jgi:putative transposase
MIEMDKKTVNEGKIQVLKKLSRKTRDSRMRTRYDAVRLLLEGRSYYEIAKILNITHYTVRNYEKSYNEFGVDGLIIKPKTGRAKKLTDEQEQQLYECISTKLPKDVGFNPFVNWTASLACKWVYEEYGVKFSERGMRDVFYRLKLSYTRPTYVLKKADPVKQEAFKEDFEVLKNDC